MIMDKKLSMSICGKVDGDVIQIVGDALEFTKDGKRCVLFFDTSKETYERSDRVCSFTVNSQGYETQVSEFSTDLIEPSMGWLADAAISGCNFTAYAGSVVLVLQVVSVLIVWEDSESTNSLSLTPEQLAQLNRLLEDDSLNSLYDGPLELA